MCKIPVLQLWKSSFLVDLELEKYTKIYWHLLKYTTNLNLDLQILWRNAFCRMPIFAEDLLLLRNFFFTPLHDGCFWYFDRFVLSCIWIYQNVYDISRMHNSKSKGYFNVKSWTYYFHMKTKILLDFQICISVPLKILPFASSKSL